MSLTWNIQEETRPKRKPVERQLNKLTSDHYHKSFLSRHSDLFETLRAELQELQSKISNYENLLSNAPALSTQAPQLIEIITDASPSEFNTPHIDDFLSEVECDELQTGLSNILFSREMTETTDYVVWWAVIVQWFTWRFYSRTTGLYTREPHSSTSK